ncbi:MAG: zinc ribbon domain-containing protein [Dehalococcoidia bacterium]|jgi:hypothetical protein
MSWPASDEYQGAIQNPRSCFRDLSLSGGQPAPNNLGLPRIASGNFACVFKIETGVENFAVRCFLREVNDQQRRYDLLTQHLAGLWLQQLTGFEYIAKGIQISGRWFPIVKMEWVEGETLDIFVERHLNNPETLRHLAAQWRGAVAGLRGAHMAHGDLQHGNVLVDQSGLIRLVDYDPMFIPSLSGEKSPELGHPNYVHPKRAEDNYDDNLDSFAALVVYLSLLALAAEPELWRRFYTGENLILTQSDFSEPAKSDCLRRLKANRDPMVAKLADILNDLCLKPPTQIPDLESILNNIPFTPTPSKNPPKKPSPIKVTLQGQVSPVDMTPALTEIKCSSCGQSNDSINLFCHKCAEFLKPVQCKRCGDNIPGESLFCQVCGAKQ